MRRVRIEPMFREEEDGTWTAWYPDHNWEVAGPTRLEATEKLKAEEASRKQDPAYREWLMKMLESPPDSWTVDEVQEEVYESRVETAIEEVNPRPT